MMVMIPTEMIAINTVISFTGNTVLPYGPSRKVLLPQG